MIKGEFPRIEAFYQIMVDHSHLFSITVNLSKSLAIRLDHYSYQDKEFQKFLPSKILDIGFKLKLDY